MKILLTGASGLLGSAFAAAAARRGHNVVGITGQTLLPIPGLAKTKSMDLLELDKMEEFALEEFPDAIVNCAAISDPKTCRKDPEGSRRLNIDLPEKLALLARHFFAPFIHVSSEQVFDGKEENYHHLSEPCPPNEYARQKLESEKRVHDLAAEFAVTLRVPLLNGNSPSGRRSIHERLFEIWERGQSATLFVDEIRQPCLTDNAADAMVELCERNDLRGIFNWAGANALSRFDMGKAILEHFGLPRTFIEPAERGNDPRFANRQARLAFDLAPLSSKLKTRPLSFAEQLDALIVPAPRRPWYNSL